MVIRPIDEESVANQSYKLTMVTLEGPNGVGKTTAWRQAMNILQAGYALNYPEGQPVPPIKGVAEPPAWFVDQGRKDTWRSLAKEVISRDDLIPEGLLKNTYFQARLFLWARRFVETEATFAFQYLASPFYVEPDVLLLKRGQSVFYGGEIGEAKSRLEQAGSAILIKDRGTGSTLRYQGRDDKDGVKVIRLIKGLYGKKFLRREDLTVLIMPFREDALRAGEQRDREKDQYCEGDDVSSYRGIKDYEGVFTKRIVEITNDPSGARNCISTTACLVALLTYAAEKEKLGLINIRGGEVVHLDFPLRKALDRLEEVGTPVMSQVSQKVMHDLNKTRYSQGWYENGEVKVRIADRGVDMVINRKI